jgi:5-methylcytosine-specific restriction endonuclease McrA
MNTTSTQAKKIQIDEVFEQYEFKDWLITIQNYRGEEELLGFATPTKYAHLLTADNYDFFDEIVEQNNIQVVGYDEFEDSHYGDFNFIVLEPDDTMIQMMELNTKKSIHVLEYLINDILRWEYYNTDLYQDNIKQCEEVINGEKYLNEWKLESMFYKYLQKNQIKVLKQITKKSITPKVSKRKTGFLHQAWASLVKDRDKKCMECNSVFDLHAHHIKSYLSHPELRNDVNNGITLCGSCHRRWHKENGKN